MAASDEPRDETIDKTSDELVMDRTMGANYKSPLSDDVRERFFSDGTERWNECPRDLQQSTNISFYKC